MDSLYNSDEFRMFYFKVLACSKHYCHDWTDCPFAHPGEKARRRDPRVFRYVGIECPQVKEGGKCPRGDMCPFAHNVFECWLHPTRYRTQLCSEPASCKRKVCFFAHTVDELRDPTTGLDHLTDPKQIPPTIGSVQGLDGSIEFPSVQNGNTTNADGWGTTDFPMKYQQLLSQESLLATLQLQSQREHQQSVSLADVSAVLQQLSLMKNQSALHPSANNDRVVQLLLLLLKELATGQQSPPQTEGLQSFDACPAMTCGQRPSLDSAFLRSTAQPHTTHRLSMDTINYGVLNGLGRARPIQDNIPRGSTGVSIASHPISDGRISLDGSSIPDFILHDTQSNVTSLGSSVSETLGMAHPGRVSVDSSSSFMSADRRISIDATPDALRMVGLGGEPLPAGFTDTFVRGRYEPRSSLDSGGAESFMYPMGISQTQVTSFPVDK